MTEMKHRLTRRSFLNASAGLVAGAAAASWGRGAFAQSFPSRNFNITIPTGQGGGADMLARAFVNSWRHKLGREFELEFFPGAAGQVGYEMYSNNREADGHNLLFGNISAEMLMYALQRPNFRFPEDLIYFCSIDIDDCGIWVAPNSPFTSVEQVIETARQRPVSVSLSRLPHPGTIGLLLLAEATGAQFNLVPYGGGNAQTVAVLNGECDVGGGGTAGIVEGARVLGVFNTTEYLLKETRGDVPLINDVFGTDIPDLYSTRSFAVHRSWAEANPEGFALLKSTAESVFDEPQFREDIVNSGVTPWAGVQFGNEERCMALAMSMIELGLRYESELSAG